ncbi:MAG: hypothetical protein K2K53_07465, partial [Oscillospiraceae bacterium]|nr:hypothetical protein [Oscillospiraceae bacterium]
TIGRGVTGALDIGGELRDFLDTKEFDAQVFDELEGSPLADELGPDTSIYYFPMIQDYYPPQP